MEVRLKVLVGANTGQELTVPGPRFFIGRAEDCQLRPRSDLISRHHCALMIEDAVVVVRDFGSKNGTFVNDERVDAEIELRTGDRLKVGPLEFEVSIGATAASKKKPKVESVKEAAVRTVKSSGGEVDIAQLLTSNPADIRGTTVETRVLPAHATASETREISLDVETSGHTGVDTVKSPKAEAETRTSVEIVTAPQKKEPGKLPAGKPATGDSRNAAADVLNKFFKRR